MTEYISHGARRVSDKTRADVSFHSVIYGYEIN
jgi:hypothetical protein